jgi:hypothetical protein
MRLAEVYNFFDKFTIAERQSIVNRYIEKALTFVLRFLRSQVCFFVLPDSSIANARRLAYTIAIHPMSREGCSMGRGDSARTSRPSPCRL